MLQETLEYQCFSFLESLQGFVDVCQRSQENQSSLDILLDHDIRVGTSVARVGASLHHAGGPAVVHLLALPHHTLAAAVVAVSRGVIPAAQSATLVAVLTSLTTAPSLLTLLTLLRRLGLCLILSWVLTSTTVGRILTRCSEVTILITIMTTILQLDLGRGVRTRTVLRLLEMLSSMTAMLELKQFKI